MRRAVSCFAVTIAGLLLTPASASAIDAEAGAVGGSGPSMVGTPGRDSASSLPIGWMEFEIVGDEAYFVTGGEHPGELWRTDGTADGTVLVTDRFATKREDPITEMTAVGDELYFAAETRKQGVELWRTDGTAAGTALVSDLIPGKGNSYPRNIVSLDDLVVFWAWHADEGCGLWRTDGTPAGTMLVRAVKGFGRPQGPDADYCPKPDAAMRVGDSLVLSFPRGRHKVWRSDGTDEGTTLVRTFPQKSGGEWVQAADGLAYFAADDGKHGRELWRTDGTAKGTALVMDLVRGPTGADPEPVAAIDRGVFFLADTPRGGRALWITDESERGASVVKKLGPNWQYGFDAGDGLLYFWADDGRHGSELWRSDGTREGTSMVRDIAAGPKSAGPMGYSDIATVGDLAYFAANDREHGIELWVTDGTRAGTRLVFDTGPGKRGTGPSWITQFGDTILFSADDGRHGRELWRSDGTPKGTHLVRDIGARMASVSIYDATAVGDDIVVFGYRGGRGLPLSWIDGATGQERRLTNVITGEITHHVEELGEGVIFTGYSARTGVEPWISNGTQAGTQLLSDIARGSVPNFCDPRSPCGTHAASSGPGPFVTVGDVTYFPASDARHGTELWRSDGTTAGTRLVRDIRPGRQSGFRGALTAAGDRLFFVADDGRHGNELWRSDGTRAGTRAITDGGKGWFVQWLDPVAVGDHVYFSARTPDEGIELWRSDGTKAGTVLVKGIRPGPKNAKPQRLVAAGDQLFFTATDGEHGRELWRSDGTAAGTLLVRDLAPGQASSLFGGLTAMGSDLFFDVLDDSDELATAGTLYRTDGTAADTQPFGEALEGVEELRRSWGEFPMSAIAGGRLYFVADDGVHGSELWSTDGTAEDTELVEDLRPGGEGSAPEWLVAADGFLYFVADDGVSGRQLWQLPLADA